MNLLDVRFITEKNLQAELDNLWVVNKCNEAQIGLGLNLNLPATAQINLTPNEIEYPLPNGLKVINRLWLQSDFDQGTDKTFNVPYRIYNGKIIFRRPWVQNDILNIDFFKDLTHYQDIDNEIDLDARFAPLYTSYLQREYYAAPDVKTRLGESQARAEWEKYNALYLTIQRQVTSYYSIQDETVINERW